MPTRNPVRASHPTDCAHCGQPSGSRPVAEGDLAFCCRGCRAVYRMINSAGLGRFYDLGGGATVPEEELESEGARSVDAVTKAWLDGIEQERERWFAQGEAHETTPFRVSCDVQGMHCAACSWLLERVALDHGAVGVRINPSLAQMQVHVPPDFDVATWVTAVRRFGYRLGPQSERQAGQSDGLLLRMGVCVALAANTMMFSVAEYLGLEEGTLFEVVRMLQWVLGTLAVWIGGPVFFKAAWRALRAGSVHLDLPISIGIVLAYAGSATAQILGHDAVFFDSVAVFVALMLVGRWLRERAVLKNRFQLLGDPGIGRIPARRLITEGDTATRIETVEFREVRAGDRLALGLNDMVPVSCHLLNDSASFTLSWIDGESEPRVFTRGQEVPAGAFHVGSSGADVEASRDFEHSELRTLLMATPSAGPEAQTGMWGRVARYYAVAVLSVATAVCTAWLVSGADVLRALEVTTAVLVVTCPCAFGIAAPLAYELVHAGLARAGVFVRRPDFLDRAAKVRSVLFDKTGTLTGAVPSIDNRVDLAKLSPEHRAVLFFMVSRSSHPKSVSVRRALRDMYEGDDLSLPKSTVVQVTELPGVGLEANAYCGQSSPSANFALLSAAEGDLEFRAGDDVLCTLRMSEALRPGARDELRRLAGRYELFILSGDRAARVAAVAKTLGIDHSHWAAEQSPWDKARVVRSRPNAFMIGDGVNDAPAFDAALCSATPAVDRPFMPTRADVYWTSPGLEPVALSLRAADALAQNLRAIFVFAVVYNVVVVAIAAAGWMAPWVAAVVMPSSTLAILGWVTYRLGRTATLWHAPHGRPADAAPTGIGDPPMHLNEAAWKS